ncbi:Mitochondrial distribution and morphology protein 10 [Malassezia yamatoensis]|uniref:Mitochondrial distribution and morphology protein 10 n=1 Tax=Malassezia yamatoensis TaxID=253288 RepID=A0AAJ5YXP3_9BASI|nr:Mitochondrial distribution and morphology protein 10 [Malassezia yamatoensis]
MYDAATVLLREYFRVTGWNEQQSYVNLMMAADILVDFPIPENVVMSTTSATLSSLFTSGRLLTFPLSGALGFTQVQTRNQLNPYCVGHAENRMACGARFLTPNSPAGLLRGDPSLHTTLLEVLRGRTRPKDMLLYGCVHVPTTYVESIMVLRLASHWQLLVTALSNAPEYPLTPLARRLGIVAPGMPASDCVVPAGTTNMQVILQMQTERTMAEYSYSVDDALWGVRVTRSMQAPKALPPGIWTGGGEVFVSVAEMSAGTQVDDDLSLCARYDMNVYSYLSDLTIGAEYRLSAFPDEDPKAVPSAESHGARSTLPKPAAHDLSLSLREETYPFHPSVPDLHLHPEPPKAAPILPDASSADANLKSIAEDVHQRELMQSPSLDTKTHKKQAEHGSATTSPKEDGLFGLLKVRASASGILALLWEGHWSRCLVSVGIRTHILPQPMLRASTTLGAEFVYVEP